MAEVDFLVAVVLFLLVYWLLRFVSFKVESRTCRLIGHALAPPPSWTDDLGL